LPSITHPIVNGRVQSHSAISQRKRRFGFISRSWYATGTHAEYLEHIPSKTLERKTRRTTMRNQERYLASRLGIHTSAPFSERHTPYGWELSELNDQIEPSEPMSASSSIIYLTLALVSVTALVVLLVFGFSKAQVLSITKHGALQRASITSMARVEKRTLPIRPCDCHVPNPQWVLELQQPTLAMPVQVQA
jgi:hypothetical protein